jgi:uncharacterized protein YecE (DUF72 family)
MAVYVGTSGWSYDHWQGLLYPPRTRGAARLDYYVRRFATVEVNNTYYRWPSDATFAAWAARAPAGFQFSVKASRGLTHFRRLAAPEEWLARMERGLRCLGPKLGILLVQLGPQFAYDLERLAGFLRLVPVGRHLAIEFRHASWHRDDVFALLERAGAAHCVMDGPGLPCLPRLTAPFAYVRLHGPADDARYHGAYDDDALRCWAERVLAWERDGHDAYVYFNNDVAGHAVRNAETLRRLVGAPAQGTLSATAPPA